MKCIAPSDHKAIKQQSRLKEGGFFVHGIAITIKYCNHTETAIPISQSTNIRNTKPLMGHRGALYSPSAPPPESSLHHKQRGINTQEGGSAY